MTPGAQGASLYGRPQGPHPAASGPEIGETTVLDAKAREALQGLSDWTGRALSRIGFSANALTAMGVALSAVAAWRISIGAFLSAGLILTAGGVLDFCDGAVARVRGTASKFGAFLDSVTDRFSDAFAFSAFAWYFFQNGDERIAVVALAAYAVGQLTSYIRAKAESLGYDCRVGLLERAERLIAINGGLILSALWRPSVEIGLWVVAVAGAVTVVQRLVHVARQAGGSGISPDGNRVEA
jgi:CDP-diacylglycerol---glycerol-3-phosphate 3-phosphatidyltransferase